MQKTMKLSLTLLSLMVLSACDLNFGSSSSLSDLSSISDVSSSDSSSSSDTSVSSSDTSSSVSSSSSSSSASSSASSSSTPSSSIEGVGYYEPFAYTSEFADLRYESGYINLDATGTQNILVIPVQISDAPCSTMSGGCEGVRSNIQKAFFGADTDTGWESLSSYYRKSSYGNLNITGTVTPWYSLNKTKAQLSTLTGYNDPTYYVLRNAVSWYKTQVGNSLTGFDQNTDGYIDAVWLIYSAKDGSQELNPTQAYEDVFWAYTFWDYEQNPNVTSPVANVYAWASYDFMYDGGYTSGGSAAVDAHTFIHETGHVLGLDDYYSYTDGDWGAAGALEMMDYNMLDHNAYTKMALDWTYPYAIDGTKATTQITLNPFESSGDCVLINNSWNGSPMDEYLLIEFYTPTGLNYLDSQSGGYPGNGLRGFTVPGIKIYHIDERMGHIDWDATTWDSSVFLGYTDSIDIVEGSYYTDLITSNSSEYSIANDKFKSVHLLEAGGINTFKNSNGYATNATLFTQGEVFTPSSFASFFTTSGKFNDGSAIGYSISVNAVSASSATISITKL